MKPQERSLQEKEVATSFLLKHKVPFHVATSLRCRDIKIGRFKVQPKIDFEKRSQPVTK